MDLFEISQSFLKINQIFLFEAIHYLKQFTLTLTYLLEFNGVKCFHVFYTACKFAIHDVLFVMLFLSRQ